MCNHSLTNAEQGFLGLAQWINLTLVVYGCGMWLCWNPIWWSILRRYASYLPSDQIVFLSMTILSFASGWSVWRIWFCHNWSSHLLPLLFYVLMIVFTSGYIPTIMLSPISVIPLVISLIGFVMSILFSVWAGGDDGDTWALVMGIVTTLLNVVFILTSTFITFHQYMGHINPYDNYHKDKDNIRPNGKSFIVKGVTKMMQDQEKVTSSISLNTQSVFVLSQ